MMTIRLNMEKHTIEPSILTESELEAYIFECEKAITNIKNQLAENDRTVAAGLKGRGEDWEDRTCDALRIYELNIAQLKTARHALEFPGLDFADQFLRVAMGRMKKEDFDKLVEEVKGRMIAAELK